MQYWFTFRARRKCSSSGLRSMDFLLKIALGTVLEFGFYVASKKKSIADEAGALLQAKLKQLSPSAQ
ncbi:hypothetical protein TIFTF001_021708 [Ficus carica]|uniref:Uncharacterized protein n=1 Tax=Ficus carica TaxID=3494 RepID=A0AA88AZ07_FICCA|nr:hypothetical protein TIFTF001_021708 [Ficus carica]